MNRSSAVLMEISFFLHVQAYGGDEHLQLSLLQVFQQKDLVEVLQEKDKYKLFNSKNLVCHCN